MSYIDAREMVAELFRQLRILVETGYRMGVVVYFILSILIILYIRYDLHKCDWLFKD